MSLKKRVERLEAMHKLPEGLTGVLYYHPELIIMDGVPYTAIEDIPEEARAKYPDRLQVGKVQDESGRVQAVFTSGGTGDGPQGGGDK